MTEYSAPVESNLSKAVVDTFAADVANQLSYAPGADLSPIVAKLGGRITIQNVLDFNRVPSGSIRIDAPGRFEIFLAAHTGPVRDRFTIAHELGHYVLHYLYPNRIGRKVERLEAQRYGSGRVEWEANWFAAGFLMPVAQFRERFGLLQGSQAALAAEFGVSLESIRIRIQSLGLTR
ncbi:MAG: ImmA/IrrE family metallo-endopeptidase [Bradyrhizobium sp.]|uniref:ImmA/IrrE family metallo-endopeptidase n=1 Tax=Bradyrhizobium sp. TaxID=376 RepID=UPI0029A30448|nr:ImmA/IrrE family metallo-endopeptidase [Bradyrhizobium sp.]MDX3968269.1 ImmA/IrrE family metallo-endopeptidase [Bradyrhizobium sp.]